jgi:hypothetical protein
MRHGAVCLGAACLGLVLALAGPPALAQDAATVAVDPATIGPAVSSRILGMNSGNWVDQMHPGMAESLKTAGITATRWPGGSQSDQFHWQSDTGCPGSYINPNATFDDFLGHIVGPAGLDLSITVNYGSDAACKAGGDPAEAAGWVAYARARGIKVSHWTVGNEVYGSWEYDLHPTPHDAATYARAVAGGFYPAMKQADPQANVGVVISPGWPPNWDRTVLALAKYDFVELHWYGAQPGQEDDVTLLTKAPQVFAAQIAAAQDELISAGRAGTPIYAGELGSVTNKPGKQTQSITQALFAGQMLGELMNAGVESAAWWAGFGPCSDARTGNFSSQLFGLQEFSGYMTFADGIPEDRCPSARPVPFGTLLPTARAFQLFALVARNGEHSLGVTLGGNAQSLRAYALTQGSGAALILFNLDKAVALPVQVSVNGMTDAGSAVVDTYDKEIYEQTRDDVWAGPMETSLGRRGLPLTLLLPPWSMNVVRLSR